jgi:hypothetical protein
MTMTEEDDVFTSSESQDELMFVVFDQAGSDGLREILAQFTHHQLNYGEIAEAFSRAGLLEAADIVTEAAQQANYLLAANCPYDGQQESPIHKQYWMRSNAARFTPEDWQYLERNDPETFQDLTRKKGKHH